MLSVELDSGRDHLAGFLWVSPRKQDAFEG
jgi:hypothetical protein